MTFLTLNLHWTELSIAIIYAVTIMFIIIAVAFFTVLERKVLAAVQRRRGPNMVGPWGLLQAFADGIKLMLKEPVFVSGVNYYIFLFAPIILLSLSLSLWAIIPLPGYEFGVTGSYSFIVVLLFSGLNSYAIILAGLSSNSRYSLIGGIRAIAQLISYEIPLSLSLLTLFCLQGSYSLSSFMFTKVLVVGAAFPSLVIFFISLLAETNRTPFDLPEAEAELVAGYNLEYSSILFALFFLAEYSNVLVAASMMSLLIVGEKFFYITVILICLLVILLRASLPRYTFQQLINLCWKSLIPAAIMTLIIVVITMFMIDLGRNELLNPVVAEMVDTIIESEDFDADFAGITFALLIAGASGEKKKKSDDESSSEEDSASETESAAEDSSEELPDDAPDVLPHLPKTKPEGMIEIEESSDSDSESESEHSSDLDIIEVSGDDESSSGEDSDTDSETETGGEDTEDGQASPSDGSEEHSNSEDDSSSSSEAVDEEGTGSSGSESSPDVEPEEGESVPEPETEIDRTSSDDEGPINDEPLSGGEESLGTSSGDESSSDESSSDESSSDITSEEDSELSPDDGRRKRKKKKRRYDPEFPSEDESSEEVYMRSAPETAETGKPFPDDKGGLRKPGRITRLFSGLALFFVSAPAAKSSNLETAEPLYHLASEPWTCTMADLTSAWLESFVTSSQAVPGYNLLIFFFVAFAIVSLMVGANWLLVNFVSNNRKNSPYECGYEPVNSPITEFNPNFLSVALIFLIYDVEVLLTFPWAYSTAGHTASAVVSFVIFLVIMLLGLAYEVLDDSFKVV